MRILPSMNQGQRGQSLVEALVALIVLAPLAAGLTLVGQYLHIQQQTRAAAREAAWAATLQSRLHSNALPARAALEQRLRGHQFADLSAGLRLGGKPTKEFADPMLLAFTGNTLLKPENLRLAVYGEASAGSLIDSLPIPASALPNAKGLVTAEVSVQTEKVLGRGGRALALLDLLDKTPPLFTARTVLLTDAWDAAGAGETASGEAIGGASRRVVRARALSIASAAVLGDLLADSLGPLIDGMHILGKIPFINTLFTAGFDKFQPGRTAPDVVPADRLVEYRDGR